MTPSLKVGDRFMHQWRADGQIEHHEVEHVWEDGKTVTTHIVGNPCRRQTILPNPIVNSIHKTTKENEMDKTINKVDSDDNTSVFHKAQGEIRDAAWRTAGYQGAKRTVAPLVMFLKKRKVPAPALKAIASFLDTDVGIGAWGIVCGAAMGALPQVQSKPRLARLAREMRVMGLEVMGNTLFDIVADPLLEIVGEFLAGDILPE